MTLLLVEGGPHTVTPRRDRLGCGRSIYVESGAVTRRSESSRRYRFWPGGGLTSLGEEGMEKCSGLAARVGMRGEGGACLPRQGRTGGGRCYSVGGRNATFTYFDGPGAKCSAHAHPLGLRTRCGVSCSVRGMQGAIVIQVQARSQSRSSAAQLQYGLQ